jgi:Ala-tRNA(Pro) deacylase
MILQRLKDLLDANRISYSGIAHPKAYTAQEVAMSAHIPGREVAKGVVVNVDGRLVMAVLPASDMLDLDLLRREVGARSAALATESEFAARFPGCERGAVPPVGNLFELETIVADDLAEDEMIAFNAGSHRELVRVAYKDYEKLVHPKVARISVRKESRALEDRRLF